MADTLPVDTTSPAIAGLARPGFQPETAKDRAIRLEHLINPTPEDWARIDAQLDARHVRSRGSMPAEYVHLLCDADSDAVTRPFPYLRKGISARLIDGGQS